ncbi:hypothetical protein Salat_0227000 [Sesamum alatum]|uniref:Uncharacterized protein n=1 Tax=Sesamum alatum TaxID=300844 RepID=A0AAE1YZ15_9LAMI|nr:hypothetical protein Salat_0227000 [Sesamum alatum]
MTLSRSLFSLGNPTSDGDGVAASTDEDDPASAAEVGRVQTSFKIDAFTHLAERVAGDTQSVQTLERLKARWATRYGTGATGSISAQVGSLATASASGEQSVTCGSSSSPRVLHGVTYNLPPIRALLQPDPAPVRAPSSPVIDRVDQCLPLTPPREPSPVPPLESQPRESIFIGSVPLNTESKPVANFITEGLKRLKSVFIAQKRRKGDLAANSRQAAEFLRQIQELEHDMIRQREKLNWLKEGDQSTMFFFQKLAAQRARWKITQLIAMPTYSSDRKRSRMSLFASSLICWAARELILQESWSSFGCSSRVLSPNSNSDSGRGMALAELSGSCNTWAIGFLSPRDCS